VNDQRTELQFLALGAEGLRVGFGNLDRALPHAGAGGKDLQGVGTELLR